MAQIKDRNNKAEKIEVETSLGRSDPNIYFQQLPENPQTQLDIDAPAGRMTEELLVSTPLAEMTLNAEDPPIVVKKKNKTRRPRVYKKFSDKYELSEEMLGRGARSRVVAVTDRKTGNKFVVKIIGKSPGYARTSILTEIDLLHYSKSHPNILTLIETFEEEDNFYLVFEMMEGGPLLQHIQRKERFTEREASLVVKDIATALKFLHDKGIAHRDLKPENILCQYNDQIVPVKICDFDLASGLEFVGCATPELTTPVGSAEYMAPEVVVAFQGDAPTYDKKCDIWSLGVILYIMLSGKAPFTGNCGESCEWENGGSCYECQRLLWQSIKDGSFQFPTNDWGYISNEAKDLVSKLLVKNAANRLNAGQVLRHKWVSETAPEVILRTPNVLSSANTDNKFDPFDLMSTEVLTYSRIMSEQEQDRTQFTDILNEGSWPKAGFGLSTPGKSDLARRRAEHLKAKEAGLKESRRGDEPVEASRVTKRNFTKLVLPSYKKSEDTLRTP